MHDSSLDSAAAEKLGDSRCGGRQCIVADFIAHSDSTLLYPAIGYIA